MFERFTERARKVMQLANQEAQRFGQENVGSEHILLGLARESSGVASNVLKRFDLDFRKIRAEAEKLVPGKKATKSDDKLPLGPAAKQIVEFAHDEAKELGNNHVGTEHLLLALLRVSDGGAAQLLNKLGLRPADIRGEVMNTIGHTEAAPSPLVGDRPAGRGKSRTTTLDSYGLDLTEQARQGKLDAVVGRRAELEEALQVLSCLGRNRLLFVGEPGVGKRTLIRGAARLLAASGTPEGTAPPRLVLFDLGLTLRPGEGAGAGDRLLAVLAEARQAEVMLALEGLPQLFAPAWAGLGWVFRAWLRGGPGAVLAAVTPSELQLMREVDAGLLEQFEVLPVRPATAEETLEVLQAARGRFEAHHKVKLSDGVLAAVAAQANQGEWAANLPGIALRLLDRVAARVHLQTNTRPTGLREMDLDVARLEKEKDAAVAGQDFEKAAALRDQAEKLKKQREQLVREWESRENQGGGGVDERAVAAVAELLRGREGIPSA